MHLVRSENLSFSYFFAQYFGTHYVVQRVLKFLIYTSTVLETNFWCHVLCEKFCAKFFWMNHFFVQILYYCVHLVSLNFEKKNFVGLEGDSLISFIHFHTVSIPQTNC